MQPISTAIFDSRTGLFSIFSAVDDGGIERCVYETTGYAGHGKGRNNPHFEYVKNVGPLPRGKYWVREERHPRFRAPVFRLTPYRETEMRGRSGFLIHGNNAENDASQGCIILGPVDREAVALHRVRILEVVPSARP